MLSFTRKPLRKYAPLRKQAGTQVVNKGMVMVVMILPPAKQNAWFILNKHSPCPLNNEDLKFKPSFLGFQLFIFWGVQHGLAMARGWPWYQLMGRSLDVSF